MLLLAAADAPPTLTPMLPPLHLGLGTPAYRQHMLYDDIVISGTGEDIIASLIN
jgi:hypothetical protein